MAPQHGIRYLWNDAVVEHVRKIGRRVGVFPSVRKQTDSVRLHIKWSRANRGLRRKVAKNLLVAKRRIWSSWTADPKW